jgi:hypothetical protein
MFVEHQSTSGTKILPPKLKHKSSTALFIWQVFTETFVNLLAEKIVQLPLLTFTRK